MMGEQNSSTENRPIEITDVNIDCLEYIFKRLGMSDLVNVAVMNNWLRTGAGHILAQNFAKKTVILKDISNFPGKNHQNSRCAIKVSADQIIIKDLKACLQFLRRFGHFIRKLEISYLYVAAKYQTYINQYINEFCANSLREITFASCSDTTFADLRQTFTSVEKVRFVNCTLGDKTSHLNNWFPRVRSLEFDGFNEVFDRSCIAVQFLHLEHIATNLNVAKEKFGFGAENVTNAIKLNPNLRSLHIHWDFNRQFFNEASEVLKNLESFKIDGCCKDLPIRPLNDVNEHHTSSIHFERVKSFWFHLNNVSMNDHLIPFTFGALENFTFQSDERIGELFLDFIRKHPTITKLTLKNIVEWTKSNISEADHLITEILPSLTELDIMTFEFTGRQALNFVNQLEELKQFHFTLKCPTSFNGLMERLPGWRGTMDTENRVKLNRTYMDNTK